VVEDDGDMRRLNTEVLRRSGYQVDAAADGAAAWDAISANRYQLLITDNHMPKLTGLELLRKLRDGRVVLPVIMATGTVPEQEFAASPWLIPDATLLKPYTIPELLATVRAVLGANEGNPVTRPAAPETNGSNPPAASGSWQAFKLSNLDWKEVDRTITHGGNPPS
jgi:DNA-binding response OmpR family regulator